VRDVTFVWSGDTAGQGWGINPEWGGMKIYETMRRLEPDFFVHSGDQIYADGPIKERVDLPGGGVWQNLVIPEKTKVAETLDEFRGNYRYNLMDEPLRRFNAGLVQYVQWDDHEVLNNWASTPSRASVSTAACRAARCSTSSCSTCAAIAAPTARTARRSRPTRRGSSGASRRSGSSASSWRRRPRGR
jgi:phosphodiesterase/alkaline phosphatase D-like protein